MPTVYPGTPEPTSFDEPGAGSVALVALFRHGLRPRVSPERVAFWQWIDVRCRSLSELRALLTMSELERHVVRLHLNMAVSVAEESEVERIVRELQGTDASHGRAGIILVDRSGLRLVPGSVDAFPEHLPPVVKATIDKLASLVSTCDDENQKEIATRALSHLYKLLQTTDDEVGRLS